MRTEQLHGIKTDRVRARMEIGHATRRHWRGATLGLAMLLFVGTIEVAAGPVAEYVDHQYQFGFQFPSDWKMQKNPSAGEAGEVRVIVKHPTKAMHVMASVGQLGRSMTRRAFDTSPNRDAVVGAMIDLTIDEVYKKTSHDIGAERMVVAEKRAVPSDAGIKFYVSTVHFKGGITILVAGVHIVPFDKPYMVNFAMVTPLDRTATQDNETITKVFNSFHVAGERPLPKVGT